ncbi:MAG: tRNA lysidine(34) synthetase TilS [Chlamydiota bacterium]
MKDQILNEMRTFLGAKLERGRPVLVGYSGGPDSQALLHLLLECRRFFPIDIHVAHVDHGWREESVREAEQLREDVLKMGLQFHVKSLSMNDFSEGNLEEQGRRHRLRFFSSLYQEHHCQALFLGHQAEDLAEGVLKRIFEGAHLSALGGLSSDTCLEGMRIWRPLLSIRKADLVAWLERRDLSFIDDPTNYSSQFLRGRMRREMLPQLAQSFGKEIVGNLCSLSQQSHEVKAHFAELNQPILSKVQEGNLDLSAHPPLPVLQIKYLIKELFFAEGITVSRQIMEGIAEALSSGGNKKKFRVKDVLIVVEKYKMSFVCSPDLIENNS